MWQKLIIMAVLVIGGLGIWLLVGWGLLSHLLIMGKINSPLTTNREQALLQFNAPDKNDRFYAGTLARIDQGRQPRVWIWSQNSLRYFTVDENTIYSYYDVCQAYRNSPHEMRVDDAVRTVTTQLDDWSQLTQAGNFIQLTSVGLPPDNDSKLIREIAAYSQPLFLSLNLEKTCVDW